MQNVSPVTPQPNLEDVLVECVFFDEGGRKNAVFVKPLADYVDPARGGLPHDFIGPPAQPVLKAAE
jgi:hypothetical protein